MEGLLSCCMTHVKELEFRSEKWSLDNFLSECEPFQTFFADVFSKQLNDGDSLCTKDKKQIGLFTRAEDMLKLSYCQLKEKINNDEQIIQRRDLCLMHLHDSYYAEYAKDIKILSSHTQRFCYLLQDFLCGLEDKCTEPEPQKCVTAFQKLSQTLDYSKKTKKFLDVLLKRIEDHQLYDITSFTLDFIETVETCKKIRKFSDIMQRDFGSKYTSEFEEINSGLEKIEYSLQLFDLIGNLSENDLENLLSEDRSRVCLIHACSIERIMKYLLLFVNMLNTQISAISAPLTDLCEAQEEPSPLSLEKNCFGPQ